MSFTLRTDLTAEECLRRLQEATDRRPAPLARFFWGYKREQQVRVYFKEMPFREGFNIWACGQMRAWWSVTGRFVVQPGERLKVICSYPNHLLSSGVGVVAMFLLFYFVPDKESGGNLFHGLSQSGMQERLLVIAFFGSFLLLLFVMIVVDSRQSLRRLRDFLKNVLEAEED